MTIRAASRTRHGLAALLLLVASAVAGADGPAETASAPRTPSAAAEDRRSPDQTYLTFPEWYLVHSPAEYAAYLGRGGPPSAFPLFAHVGQFWSGYGAVNREIERYPFNGGYHLMVMVIGTSTTVEYGLKGLYERTIGRLAEATRTGSEPVPEERQHAALAQAYVDFIRVEPWYLFDFLSPLRRLWADLPLAGPNLLRRWERRFALSSELLVKEGYARLIKLGSQSVYEAPKPVTAIVVSRAPLADPARHPDYVARAAGGSDVLATVPRYAAFTGYSRWLAGQGIDFREIAGNDGDVLVSLLVPQGWAAPASARPVLEQPILTRPGTKRAVLAVPVGALAALLRTAAAARDVVVEHIYDF